MDKAPDAFRTISEVADDLDVPQHVLRFWETRFSQIKPMKRSGGRRYYRPDDVDLLRGIRRLLYGEGYTIRGVQRILKEHGVKSVQGLVDGSVAPPFASPDKTPSRKSDALLVPVEQPIARSDDDHDEPEDDVSEEAPLAILREPAVPLTSRANYVARPLPVATEPSFGPDIAPRDEATRQQQDRMEQERRDTLRREQDRLARERIDLEREAQEARRLERERLEQRQREREEFKAAGLRRVLNELIGCRKALDTALKGIDLPS